MGTVASAHHMDGLSELAADIVGIALGLAVAMLAMAYRTVRIPRQARLLTAMSQAMDAGQAVSGKFRAGLRDLAPAGPGRHWRHGRVKITSQSVSWAPMAGRARDLTGAQCTGARRIDPTYTEITLRLPARYKGESVHVITLHADATDIELAASAQVLEIIRYGLARTAPGIR